MRKRRENHKPCKWLIFCAAMCGLDTIGNPVARRMLQRDKIPGWTSDSQIC